MWALSRCGPCVCNIMSTTCTTDPAGGSRLGALSSHKKTTEAYNIVSRFGLAVRR